MQYYHRKQMPKARVKTQQINLKQSYRLITLGLLLLAGFALFRTWSGF